MRMFSMAKAARLAELEVGAVRRYEQRGFITVLRVGKNKRRVFPPIDIRRLKMAKFKHYRKKG